MGRPGVMLYFDMLEPIRNLSDAERGKLLTAILEYGKDGTVPNFKRNLAIVWGFMQPKIDRDDASYSESVQKRKYASFCSKRSQKNLPKLEYEEWLALDEQQRRQMVTGAGICVPTTTATSTATATTNTITNTNTAISSAADADEEPEEAEAASLEAAAAAERKKLKSMHGLLGQGVVHLTDEQIETLLDKLGLEEFDRYVRRLSDFIRNRNASVGSHYATILKWWTQDSTADMPPEFSR